MSAPFNGTDGLTDYDLASTLADNAISVAGGFAVSLTMMVIHARKSSLDMPSMQENNPLRDEYVSGFTEESRTPVAVTFDWRTAWQFSGYLCWASTGATFQFGDGVLASTRVPFEISFERVKYVRNEQVRWSIENLVVRRGEGEFRLPWSTEVRAEVELFRRIDDDGESRYLELRFVWREDGRITNSLRHAHLYLYAGPKRASGDDGFRKAVGADYQRVIKAISHPNSKMAIDVMENPEPVVFTV